MRGDAVILDWVDLELFAGPGGWSQGRAALEPDLPAIGIEWDEAACATATTAGHTRILGDVALQPIDPWRGRVRGLIASPPCGGMSGAGGGPGRLDFGRVQTLLTLHAHGHPVDDVRFDWADERSHLTAEPMRWIRTLEPEWVALEQVPAVAPIWERYAILLRGLGYRAWSGVVRSERHGVPSTRKRAVLVASRTLEVGPPPVTTPSPITMGEALGIDDGRELVSNYGTGGDPKARGRRGLNQCAPTMTGKCGRNRWVWPDGSARNLTVPEAGVLNGFPADYPWQGGATQRQQQVGDAVPPPLATALLSQVLDVPRVRTASPSTREEAA